MPCCGRGADKEPASLPRLCGWSPLAARERTGMKEKEIQKRSLEERRQVHSDVRLPCIFSLGVELYFNELLSFMRRWLKLPVPHGSDGALRKKRMSAFYFYRLDAAIGLNQCLELYDSMNVHGACQGWILGGRFVDHFTNGILSRANVRKQ